MQITQQFFREVLSTRRYGRSIELRNETGSTNDDARTAAAAGAPSGHVIVTDHQRNGRGSRGRSWSSPPGVDLYLSILERCDAPLADLGPLTLAVGLGVADCVDEVLVSTAARVKWPNDVLVDQLKVAGILVETSSRGAHAEFLVIGIGLGVNRARFEGELTHSATSLSIAAGRTFDRTEVLARLLGCVERRVDQLLAESFISQRDEFQGRMAYLGSDVDVDGAHGTLLGVSATGALRIQTPAGIREILAGTLRPIEPKGG